MAQPVSMTATAEKLEPVAYEAQAEPDAAPVAEAVPEPAAIVDEAPIAVAPTLELTPVSFGIAPDRSADSFIPPRPTEAPPRQALPPQLQQGLQQPVQAPVEKKRGYTLFERVTGAARRAETASAQPAAPPPQRAIPTLGTGTPTRSQHYETNIAPAGQPRLGIDAPARPKASSPEDDLLEIPAFLRRQAN
jgi:cell division protein FtsZ